MKQEFLNSEGSRIIYDLIKVIHDNKQYLSDIDGAIGDGDHGINMNKGFSICEQKLKSDPGDLTHSLEILSEVLMKDIGGSMGPLYGMFFVAMADACRGKRIIDSKVFGKMLADGKESIIEIGSAKVGDKTLLDTLAPAVEAFNNSVENGNNFIQSVEDMKKAAIKGRDSTKNMVAKLGRASRLGKRSIGVIDAGAASCCLILESMADTIEKILE